MTPDRTIRNRIGDLAFSYRCWRYQTRTRTYQWLAHRMPARLRYFAAIDVGAYASTGKYGDTIVPELTLMDAIQRFERDKMVEAR
jgi:hypothetical protein